MPIFTKLLRQNAGGTEETVREIANHIRYMQEELEYRLTNLDSSNINAIDTDETQMSGSSIERLSALSQTVSGLSSTVLGQGLKISTLQYAVGEQDESIATLQETSSGLSAAVESLEGQVTAAQTTAGSALTAAQQIANGTYSGGTFIDEGCIYSPTLYGRVCLPGSCGTSLPDSGMPGQVFFLLDGDHSGWGKATPYLYGSG